MILRLVELGNPAALPALERAFANETHNPTREFLAAALVNLGDKEPKYFAYVSCRAITAVKSGVPFPVDLGAYPPAGMTLPPLTRSFESWARRHKVGVTPAMYEAAFDDSWATQALGEAADRRSRSIFLRGLHSPNILVAFESSLGLARVQNARSVPDIVAATKRMRSREKRILIAKALLYLNGSTAQIEAKRIIRDPVLIGRWRVEVNRRGRKLIMRDSGY